MTPIKYRLHPDWKYTLAEPVTCQTDILPNYEIVAPFGMLSSDGLATISAGYSWDGCSGPAIDSPDNMRGGLVHDFFYQMFRMQLLSADLHKARVDSLLYRLLREDGMSWVRAKYYWLAVTMFGASSTNEKEDRKYRPVLTAP